MWKMSRFRELEAMAFYATRHGLSHGCGRSGLGTQTPSPRVPLFLMIYGSFLKLSKEARSKSSRPLASILTVPELAAVIVPQHSWLLKFIFGLERWLSG